MAAKWAALCRIPAYDLAFTVITCPMSAHPAAAENRVAVLVDCDNTEPEILEQFELVVNTVSMEEAVQQQADTIPADVSEASEP